MALIPPKPPADPLSEDLTKMVKEARDQGLWLWMSYHDLWFSPDELAEAHAKGRFLWGRVNWKLRHPRELLQQAEKAVEAAKQNLTRIEQRISASGIAVDERHGFGCDCGKCP